MPTWLQFMPLVQLDTHPQDLMAAGLSETVMDWTDIVEAMDADASASKRGPYKMTAQS
jgi:hypothetical protein